MRAKTILTMLFLVSLGVVSVLVLHSVQWTGRTGEAKAAEPVEVLAAAAQLAPGTLLRSQDVTWGTVSEIPAGAIVRPTMAARSANADSDRKARAEVFGAALRTPLAAGTPLVLSAIIKPTDRDFLHVVLSPGARAIAVPVAIGGAGTGLLFAGDRVDVLLTQLFKNEDMPLTRRSVSETVVENLRVLAIDNGEGAKLGSNTASRTITLEVTPEQAEKVNVAVDLGRLSLTLRAGDSEHAGKDATPGPGAAEDIRATWAADVSPALRSVLPKPKIAAAQHLVVKVMHGSKSEELKSE
jgi:pilus assembly protein CpaB